LANKKNEEEAAAAAEAADAQAPEEPKAAAEPEAAQPETPEPEAPQPEAAQAEASEPEAAEAAPEEAEAAQPEAAEAAPAEAAAPEPDAEGAAPAEAAETAPAEPQAAPDDAPAEEPPAADAGPEAQADPGITAEAEPAPTLVELAADARYSATGKRKSAVARVIVLPGTGAFVLNGKPLEGYFPRKTLQEVVRQPLKATGYLDRVDVRARIHGGGVSSQADAVRHGIAKALIEADPNLRGELKRRQLLTRDPRVKERRKAGLKKARKRPQFSKR
jgi:small subunit ribosomal protein S9